MATDNSIKESFETAARVTANPFNIGLQNANMPDAQTASPDVTNFTDQKFHVDAAQAAPAVAASGVQGPDIALNEQDIKTTQANYMQADADIKEIVVDAINEVMGPEQGGKFTEHIFPGGAPTKLQAGATMLDPTGVAGSIYSVLNAVAKQADRFGSQETLEVLDKVLNKLQEANNPSIQNAMNNENYFPPKEGYDFSGISAKELLDFLERKPEQDPIMRELQQSLDTIDGIKDNAAYNEEHKADFAEERFIQGDASALEDMQDHEAEAMEAYSSYAVEMTCDSLTMPCHMNYSDPQFAGVEEIKAALAIPESDRVAPSQDLEDALQRTADPLGRDGPGAMTAI